MPRPAIAPTRRRTATLRTRLGAAFALALVLVAGSANAAERTLAEFWPELDVFVKLDDQTRLFLLGTITRAAETGTSTESTLGAHLDWFPATLPSRLLEIAPGMGGRWSVWTRIGIQHIAVSNGTSPSEERLIVEGTLRSAPLWQSIRIANRIRFDLRAIGDETSWRFRDRLRIERTWAVPRNAASSTELWSRLPTDMFSAFTPYGMIEVFWDSRYEAWSRRFEQIGVEFDLAPDRSFDLFLARQTDLRQRGPTLQIGGVALTFRF